ncbi:hypothetical protein C7B77_19695 [Chamaesiphon polymorphus CCALA 037]|uniref:Uncharacterized protein n=1 Tax=Chamaesiphon polymorphus CCALA 037 TaxID=2107692 RepID=A0A2T1G7Q6_9CYAN|nr:hypothetical protein C7B77_19695 [Chamaesiphon polymorphus CCALA 037]
MCANISKNGNFQELSAKLWLIFGEIRAHDRDKFTLPIQHTVIARHDPIVRGASTRSTGSDLRVIGRA